MRKINLGCGGNKLEGWENHDMDMDITKPLPFQNNEIDYIFAEHVIEHIEFGAFIRFLRECKRILKQGGTLRLAYPSLTKFVEMVKSQPTDYFKFLLNRGFSKVPNWCGALNSIFYNHKHKFMYDDETMVWILEKGEFKDIYLSNPGYSLNKELTGIEGHGKAMSDKFNELETTCVEATK